MLLHLTMLTNTRKGINMNKRFKTIDFFDLLGVTLLGFVFWVNAINLIERVLTWV